MFPIMINNYDGKRFYNLDYSATHGKFKNFIKWQFNKSKSKWPKWVDNIETKPIAQIIEGDRLVVTFINHSTVLIQTQGLNILTDPVYSDRVSPFTWVGPKRVKSPGIAFDLLPKIDIILLSHDHYDHLDMKTLLRLHHKFSPKIYSGLKINKILQKGHKDLICHEMGWWDNIEFKEGVKIHFLPAKHWSGRNGFYNHNTSLWGSFTLETKGGNIYFAGDTGYANHFSLIKEHFHSFRLSLLPIGAYEPRYFLKDFHTNPEEAVLAHKELNSKYSMAIHYGTFKLSDEEINQPGEDLLTSLASHNIDPNHFRLIKEGDNWEIPL